jgi:hypothetical protein
MPVELYRVLHFIGIIGLFFSLSALALSPAKRKGYAILHGVSLLIILIAGFAMLGKMQLGFPGWAIGKLVIWLALGGVMVLLKRGALKGMAAGVTLLGLGSIAIWLAVYKPF